MVVYSVFDFSRVSTKMITEPRNILLHECKSALFILRGLGLLPIGIHTSKNFKFKFLLSSATYIVIFYIFTIYITTKQFLRRSFIISLKICDFDCLIFSLATLIVLVPSMLIPVAFWLSMKQTIMFWDEWYNFQVLYTSLIGKPINVHIKTFVTIFVVTSYVAVIIITTLPSALIANLNIVATSTYYVVFGGFIAGVSYWLSVCLLLKHTIINILRFFNKSFAKWEVNRENIIICYELWTRVLSLLKQFGSSMQFFLLIYGFTLMLTMLNSMYGFTSQLYTTELKSRNIKHAIGHILLFLWSSHLIFIINESSHQVVSMIQLEFKKLIFQKDMNKMGSFTQRQVVEFYQIFRNAESNLSFSYFNEFSRSFFITILGAIVTYMVIMLQIRNDYLLSQKKLFTSQSTTFTNSTYT